MRKLLLPLLVSFMFTVWSGSYGQVRSAENTVAPLRVVIIGMVHGHVEGFLSQSLHRPDIQIVGISEPDQAVALKYASQFQLDKSLLFPNLEEMLQKTHPQAALVYTNTFDHRKAVETCARYGVPVMMEKPLAVSLEDARAIEKAAKQGKIQVLRPFRFWLLWRGSRHLADGWRAPNLGHGRHPAHQAGRLSPRGR